MREWLTSGRVKIERAYQHIDDLEREIAAFHNRRPYRLVVDPDAQNGRVVRIQQREAIPLIWSAVAADAIHNLSACLDHLWQRAVHGSRSSARDYFPAYAGPDSASARFRGKEKGRCKAAVDLLRQVNAFEVGNPFWTIRCFDDADKHDTLTLVALGLKFLAFDLTHIDPKRAGRWEFLGPPTGEFFPLEDGAVFSTPFQWPEVDVDHEMGFEIAFGQGEVLKYEPVVPTLHHLAAAVDSLASVFETNGLLG